MYNIDMNKEIVTGEDIHPIFRNHFLSLNIISKIWLFVNQSNVSWNANRCPKKLTPLERFMAEKSYLLGTKNDKCNDEELKFLCIANNGMPTVPMSDEDKLILKDILNVHMSNEEQVLFEKLKKDWRELHGKYAGCKALLESGKIYEPLFKSQLNYAINSGWFDELTGQKKPELDPVMNAYERVIQPTKEQIEQYKENPPQLKAPEPDKAESEMEKFAKQKEAEVKNKKKKTQKIDIDFVDGLINTVAEDQAAAAMSATFIDQLANGASDALIESFIGMIKGFTIMALNKSDTEEMAKDIRKSDVDFIIDSSVDGIDGLKKVILIILETFKKIAESDGKKDTVIQIVSDAFNEVNSDLTLFKNAKFIDLLKKVIKNKNIPFNDEKPAEIPVKIVDLDAGAEAAAAAASQSMMAYPEVEDNGKPAFCDPTIKPPVEVIKDKPAFIVQANQMTPIGEGTVPPAKTIECQIDVELRKNYKWLERIAGIAATNGTSVIIRKIPGNIIDKDGKATLIIVGMRVDAYTNGQFNHLKSFTIDLGYVIDDRTKIFFNFSSTGVDFMEKCDESYRVFDNDNDKKKVLCDGIFQAIFKYGTSGISDEDRKRYILTRSNLAQLNRKIELITIPTKLPRDERIALKDAAFKMKEQIAEISRLNNIDFGRFRCASFDKEKLTMVLSNVGSTLYDRVYTGPRCLFTVTVKRDEKGNIVKDDKDRATITYTMAAVDNVFDVNGLKFPNGATTYDILDKEEVNEKEAVSAEAQVVVEAEDDEDEDEKPSFITEAGEAKPGMVSVGEAIAKALANGD